MTARITHVEFKEGRAQDTFVPDPHFKGRYLKVNACVAFVDCPDCGSARGTPCKGTFVYVAWVHRVRRGAFQSFREKNRIPGSTFGAPGWPEVRQWLRITFEQEGVSS